MIFPDGRRATAKALGANFSRDSGLAKITDPGKWPHVEMGHSDDIKPGTWCMALGHPGGIQQGRTPPIRLGRVLIAGKGARFLVTDATVISGDSGGPLFDLEGRVIGIHSNIGMNVNQNQHVPIDVYPRAMERPSGRQGLRQPADLHARTAASTRRSSSVSSEFFFQRLMAGDPEARGLMKDGHLNVTPEDLDRLIAKWEKSTHKASRPPPAGNRAAACGRRRQRTAGLSQVPAALPGPAAGRRPGNAQADQERQDDGHARADAPTDGPMGKEGAGRGWFQSEAR